MTFEEFFEHCHVYMPSDDYSCFVSPNQVLVMMTFNNPHGRFWTHTIALDKEALLNPTEAEKYVAETLFHKLKEIKEI